MAIISHASMQRLQKRLGPKPDEGQIFIRRSVKVNDGAGRKDSITLTGPIPARVGSEHTFKVKEIEIAGRPGAEHRYIVELPAYTPILATDEVLWAGVPWKAGQRVLKNERCIPLTPNGKVYAAENEGVTGATEPVWVATKGNIQVDGGVSWKCLGDYTLLQVIEVAEMDSYEVTRDVYCDLRT